MKDETRENYLAINSFKTYVITGDAGDVDKVESFLTWYLIEKTTYDSNDHSELCTVFLKYTIRMSGSDNMDMINGAVHNLTNEHTNMICSCHVGKSKLAVKNIIESDENAWIRIKFMD